MTLQTYLDANGRPAAANALTQTVPEDPANVSGLAGRELQRMFIQNQEDGDRLAVLEARNPIYLSEEGAVGDWTGEKGADNTAAIAAATDDSAALEAALMKAMDESRPLAIDLRCYIGSHITLTVTGDLEIIGLPGSELYFNPPSPETEGIRIYNVYTTEGALAANVIRGASTISLVDATGFNLGDSITLLSNQVVDPGAFGFGAKACDTFAIVGIDGNDVQVNGSCTFPYDIGSETVTVRHYVRRELTMTDVKLTCDEGVRIFSVVWYIVGMRCTLRNCIVENWTPLRDIDGFSFLDSPFLEIYDAYAEGVRYAHLANQSRHYYVIRGIGSRCRHFADCATHTVDILYQNCRTFYCNAGLTTHGCFDLKIRDCVTLHAQGGMPSPRAWGCDIDGFYVRQDQDSTYYQLHTYWGHPNTGSLAAPYAFLPSEYDVVLRRVDWVANAANIGAFNGINVYSCRRLIIDKCRTHAVATAFSLLQVCITDSTIGTIHMSQANSGAQMQIANVIFDGSLGNYKTPFTKASKLSAVACFFRNYDNTGGDGHLFDLYVGGVDWHSQFVNCVADAQDQIGGIAFQSPVNTAIPDAYGHITFVGSRFDFVTTTLSNIVMDEIVPGGASISGTPTVNHLASWLNATTLQEISSIAMDGGNLRLETGNIEMVNTAVTASRSSNNWRFGFYGSGSVAEFYDNQNSLLRASLGTNLRLWTGSYQRNVETVTATGSDQSGAAALSAAKDWHYINSGAAGAGVKLPALTVGIPHLVYNGDNDSQNVYPDGTETIDGGAASAPISLASGELRVFYPITSGVWISK